MSVVDRRVVGDCLRAFDFEPTADPSDGRTLEGYAAVFGQTARIAAHGGDFDEVIRPGAFTRSLKARTPVLQWEHGKDPRVGAVPIGAITDIGEDGKGLHVRARLFDNPVVEPIRQAIAERAVKGMSFRFLVPDGGDRWSRGAGRVELREVIHADVPEVSPVVFAAYDGTSVAVRSLLAGRYSDRASRQLVAYVACWGTEVLCGDGDGGRMWSRKTPDAFEQWLAGNPTNTPIMVNHGRDFVTDRPEPVLAERAGVWESFTVDKYGLLATGYLDDTPLGLAVAQRIDAGELVACSYRASVLDSRELGTRDGLDRVELTCLDLTEAGPTSDPADPGAVIVSLGGQAVRSVPSPGVDRPRVASFLSPQPAAMSRWAVQDAADRIERICYALRAKRREADRLYSFANNPVLKSRDDFPRYLEAEREAEQIKADLLEAVNHDRGLFADLCARYGIAKSSGLLRNMFPQSHAGLGGSR